MQSVLPGSTVWSRESRHLPKPRIHPTHTHLRSRIDTENQVEKTGRPLPSDCPEPLNLGTSHYKRFCRDLSLCSSLRLLTPSRHPGSEESGETLSPRAGSRPLPPSDWGRVHHVSRSRDLRVPTQCDPTSYWEPHWNWFGRERERLETKGVTILPLLELRDRVSMIPSCSTPLSILL